MALDFACIDCGTRGETAGKCASCGADGLLDLRDSGVRAELVKEDDQRTSKRRQQMIWVAVPVGAGVFILTGMGILGFFAGAASGYGVSLALAAVFPARHLFPYARS